MSGGSKPKKSYDIVQQGIRELYTSENPEIDIVAVPGLGAPPLESWKSVDPKNDFNWLTDTDGGLAKEFPKSRIMLYMYQSAWAGPLKVRQFMGNLSTTLLQGLKDKRKDHPRRPLIFIGHSMGGLVIAKAISYADSRRDIFGKMFEAITGCIVFGTPFDGAYAAGAASMFAHISEWLSTDLANTSKLLDLMKQGDESLRELTSEFLRLVTKMSPKIEVFCFYEELPTDWSRQVGLPFKVPLPKKLEEFVTRESALPRGLDGMGLKRTHRELVKFDSFKDPVYQLARGPIRSIINSAPLIAKNRFNATRGIDRDLVKNVLSALEGVSLDRKRKHLSKGIISSSWIVQEQEYKLWLEKSHRMIDCLWIVAPEGKGKLGASLAAIDNIDEMIKVEEAANTGQAAVILAWFLCDSTPEGSSPEEVLKSLLRQVIYQQEALVSYAKQFAKPTAKGPETHNKKAQAQLTVENLWQSLQDILTDELVGTVYFVINNLHFLDEEADSTKKLMEFITFDAAYDGPRSSRVRWIFTSQDRHSIRQALNAPSVRVIDLDDEKYGNQVQQELIIHAQKKVTDLGKQRGYNKALTYFAGSLIGKRAQNTQWIDITIIQLAELPPDARDLKVRSLLERVPQNLNALLDRAWLSVLDMKDEDYDDIREMLRTLVITYEDPKEDELAVMTDYTGGSEMREHLCNLVQKCRPLITLRKTGNGSETISFMNSVVKAHLIENAEKLLGLSAEERRWQHGILALRNFTHLMEHIHCDEPVEAEAETEDHDPDAADDDAEAAAEDNEDQDGNDEESEPEYDYDYDYDDSEYEEEHMEDHLDLNEHPDLSLYAVKHWLHHASKATADIAESLSHEEEFWKPGSPIRQKWLKIYAQLTKDLDRFPLETFNALHVAASVGFSQLVSALMKNGYADERDVRDGWDNTPLHLAAYCGRANIAEVLLNSGAKIDDGKEDNVSTPLAMAACKGHCKVMAKLLNRGADPNSLGDGVPVINEAISSGNMEAVKLLVQHGSLFTLDESKSSDTPPLALAALLSDLAMFTYLLDACADKIPHAEYDKAFVHSAMAGRADVVKRLLEFDHEQSVFQQAFDAAATEANWEIVLLIMNTRANLECNNVFYLVAVGSEQQDKILSTVWKYCNGNITHAYLNRSLYEAVDHEKESTVRLLLSECRADPNATGDEFGNALTAATYDGTINIIKMLLEYGADVNSSDGWALQAAAEQGHLEVVEFLLQPNINANVNAVTNSPYFYSGTALQAACDTGHVEIVKLLLKHRADPNLGGGSEVYPIIATCRKGESDILGLLLDAGASVNVTGGYDESTPLVIAAGTMFKDSVERLLNAGAYINQQNSDGDTALIVAAAFGDTELVPYLLLKGADIFHVNKAGQNALQAAHQAESTECAGQLITAVSRILVAVNSSIQAGNQHLNALVRSVDFSGLEIPDEEENNEEGAEPESDDLPMDTDAIPSELQPVNSQEPAAVPQDYIQTPTHDEAVHQVAAQLSSTTIHDEQSSSPGYQSYPYSTHYDVGHNAHPGYSQAPEVFQPPPVIQTAQEPPTKAPVARPAVSAQGSVVSQISQTLQAAQYAPPSNSAQYAPPSSSSQYAPPSNTTQYAPPSSSAQYAPTSASSSPQPQANYSPYAPPPPGPNVPPKTNLDSQSYSGYQGSQGYSSSTSYQAPARKPISALQAEEPGRQSYQGSQDYQNYQAPQASQTYQSQQEIQKKPSPAPTQAYPSPRPSQGYQSPPSSQGYQSPPQPRPYQPPAEPAYSNYQNYHTPPPSSGSYQSQVSQQGGRYNQSPTPSQGYAAPPQNQSYQPPATQAYGNSGTGSGYPAQNNENSNNNNNSQGQSQGQPAKFRWDSLW